MGSLIGKITEKLGWLTADRDEEAKGRLEQADAAGLPPKPGALPADEEEAAKQVALDARRDVKADYGEVDPRADQP